MTKTWYEEIGDFLEDGRDLSFSELKQANKDRKAYRRSRVDV